MAFVPTPSFSLFTKSYKNNGISSSRRPRTLPTACAQASNQITSPFHHQNQKQTLQQQYQVPDRSLDSLLQALKDKQADPNSPSYQTNVHESNSSNSAVSTVHLVGTGPGDPGLLTLRAVQLMQNADIVLYDRLVSPEILKFIRPQATMVYVGKENGFHTRSQDDIHLLLNAFANPNSTVVRLKGGDPFVFGRGGEETEYLEQNGVHIAAVPGITAAAGIAANLGIPLTKRTVASSVRFLTGHARSGAEVDIGSVDIDTTYVIYMGLGQLENLVEQFVERGLPSSTPAIAVENGTTPQQRVVAAELDQLSNNVRKQELQSPTLIIIGNVVRMSKAWSNVDSEVSNNLRDSDKIVDVSRALQILEEYDNKQ